ncbi:MAG TPA: hypothetical protein VMF89_30650, partial [Polyangiales bacterium]|nr:hypothetical protein [Polyangiales bacterium]
MKKTWWKYAAGTAATLLLTAAVAGILRFEQRATRIYQGAQSQLELPVGEQALARGEHFAQTIAGCSECHGADFGGKVMGDDVMMRLVASNLTRGAGSAVRDYEPGDWWNAIVNGRDR